jgi:uncharacterized protein YjbI with pentapeptide repeats
VTFLNCRVREADFSQAKLEEVSFVDCDLSRAMFERASLKQSVMRGCGLSGLRGVSNLRGVRMPLTDILGNAELFASELGIGTV